MDNRHLPTHGRMRDKKQFHLHMTFEGPARNVSSLAWLCGTPVCPGNTITVEAEGEERLDLFKPHQEPFMTLENLVTVNSATMASDSPVQS